VKYLINKYSVEINIRDKRNRLPYQLVEKEDNTELYNYLLMKSWMEAALDGDISLMRELLIEDVDVNVVDPEISNKSALFLAVKSGNIHVVKFLIQNGANVNLRDENGENALWEACASGHLQIVKYLIENGIKWNYSVPKYGFPISQAVLNNNLSIVKYFIEDLNFDINSKDYEGWTLLHTAAYFSSSPEIVKYLLAKGANKSIRNNDGELAFQLAKDSEIKRLLIPTNSWSWRSNIRPCTMLLRRDILKLLEH